ncbi:MAG: type II secretion system protein [Burkholderiales bacterium]
MNQRGFTYAMVLAAIVIVGIVVEAARVTTWRILRVDREAELLFRGLAYRNAIGNFYQSNGAFPRSLDDLLKDPRSASKRHIRALYDDPMTRGEWSLVRAAGGISGVASASREEPLKQANFPRELEKFTGAKSYSEWVFEYVPPPPRPSTPVTPPPARPPVLTTS